MWSSVAVPHQHVAHNAQRHRWRTSWNGSRDVSGFSQQREPVSSRFRGGIMSFFISFMPLNKLVLELKLHFKKEYNYDAIG